MPSSKIAALTEDTTPDASDVIAAQNAAGTVDKRVPYSVFTALAAAAQAAAEATAANASNLTSGTVADARIASTIARDTEVTSAVTTHNAVTANAHGILNTAALPAVYVEDGDGGYVVIPATARLYIGAVDPTTASPGGRDENYDIWLDTSV